MRKITAFLSILSMLLMVLFVVWQVFTRYFLHKPSTVSEEIVTFSLITLSFLGGAYCFNIDAHISITLIDIWAKEPWHKSFLYALRQLVNLCFALVLVGGSFVLVKEQHLQLSTALKIPMGFIYAIPGVSGLCIALSVFYKLFSRNNSSEITTKGE